MAKSKSYKQFRCSGSGTSFWNSLAIGFIIRKRLEKKQEVMNADENPGYGVYHLSETYERQYSTNEAVDNNDYYAQ